MLKMKIITDKKSIEKNGGDKMYFKLPKERGENVILEDSQGKRRVECKISGWFGETKETFGGGRANGDSKRKNKYQILCEKL